jgi:predicted metalloprotease with PDZ domain
MRGHEGINDRYLNLLGLASHEYFHGWNIKRIKPEAFTPYDLARENYTRQLWAFEGITSYYDDLALVRCGLIGEARYLELLGRTITSVLRTPGRHRQSVAESSFDAWIKFYRPDENSPNAVISYYAKGALVALALDLTLRSAHATSLDAVMRELWTRHGQTGVGVGEHDIAGLVTELAGRDMHCFFERYVYGTDDPPLDALLGAFGIDWHLRATSGVDDSGGKAASMPPPQCWLGAKISSDLRLQNVFAGGPAERAGLAPGDVLVAIDGIRASTSSVNALLADRAPGERVSVHAFRRDDLTRLDVELQSAPLDVCYLTPRANATDEANALRRAWLGP